MQHRNTSSCLIALGAAALAMAFPRAVHARSMDEALRAFKTRNFPDAAILFYDILQNDESSDARDQAEIYLAETLRKMGLYMPALFYYQDVLEAGRQNRYYLNAVEGLLDVQEELHDPVLVPVLIDSHYDPEGFARLSETKIARINYMMGEFSLRRGKLEDARQFLEFVPEHSRLHAFARYLLAVLSVQRGDAEAALEHFRAVTQLIPAGESDPERRALRNLALLGTARVYYGAGDYEAASDAYQDVPRFSDEWFAALYEGAWAYFQQEEYGRALGEVQSVTSPFFAKRHTPEAHLIAGTTYFFNCQWDRVREAVRAYTSAYEAMERDLRAYLGEQRDPSEYYRDVVAGGNGRFTTELAREVRRRKRFLDFHHMLSHMAWEQEEVAEIPQWKRSRLAQDLGAILTNQRGELERAVGTWARARLQFLADQLRNFGTQINILDFEVTDAERIWLEQGKEILKGRRARLPRPEIPNDQWQHWSFEGEYWKDELGHIQHTIHSECF